ncbi:tetratricopeptide repeat protein 4 homolog [Dioscorea cayenensis subsp. rotundata]|uniref:Tetratricopeptide repeat protein 4 homolog n=1 Tax=Dioscorea cayennensis subsp. rotundata TaxID=55577 RepID=A0AB40C5L2_DIOCR|nr:tetratricopeptide repeat protein 4 homolog [Dioscorea cayenensis subsp. rotundata]
MALWMEQGSEPVTESEQADLAAIAAIKESAAVELKEKGNKFVKLGKKHYSDAIDCYTKALNQMALSDSEHAVLYANRAHVNLLLGNHRRALEDAQEAIKLSATNVKAFYRAAKAAFFLGLLVEAASYCQSGLELNSENEELKKLFLQVNARKEELEKHNACVSKVVSEAKELASVIENRGYKLGKPMYRELIGSKKPILDKSGILHWPVVLLYAEVMSSDLIEDFCETDVFATHLDMMFSEDSPPLEWDKKHAYTRNAVELYYQVGSGALMSKKEILRHLLEGTVASSEALCEDDNDAEQSPHTIISASSGKWVKVNEKKTLHNVLEQPDYVIPGIPVFFVVSNQSNFYKDFTSGKWSSP